MYFDYLARVEQVHGLIGRPRAVVFHIKNGREHCHAIWSRIDAARGRAVHLAFDHDKLMMITRAFAREYGLRLPGGYYKDKGRHNNGQLSLYEQHQQRTTGLTKAKRMEQVNDAWRGSDSPQAFVQALAAQGYILAAGNRPYVLVDIYGHVNALPRLIDDRTVRLREVRAFLENDFPQDSMPTIEEAKSLAAAHRRALGDHCDYEQKAEAITRLKEAQARRRRKVVDRQKRLRQRRHDERQALAAMQRAARDARHSAYLAKLRAVRRQRRKTRPTGLAAFLGRITGMTLICKKLRRFRDRHRYRTYLTERGRLRDRRKESAAHCGNGMTCRRSTWSAGFAR